MKEGKNFLLGLLSLVSLKLISAYGSNFYSFNLGDLFFSVREYILPAILFLGFFYAFNLVFRKIRMKNHWIIALILSSLMTYGFSTLNINLNSLIYKIGFMEDFIFHFGPWILLALFAIALWKWGFCKMLMIAGIIFFVLGIAGIAEQGFLAIAIGVILFLIGLAICKRKDIPWWRIKWPGLPKINGPKEGEPKEEKEKSKKRKLIRLAKKFKQESLKKHLDGRGRIIPPKVYNSWANFINFTKKEKWGKYGRNETEICRYFGVSRNEFIWIFNKYGKL